MQSELQFSPKGICWRLRIIAVEAILSSLTIPGCHGPRPADSHPMSLQVLVAKIRGSGSISNPVEVPGMSRIRVDQL